MSNTPKLDVPLVMQLDEGYCLPACIEMVLAFYGIQRTQIDIAQQLEIYEGLGIPASRITRIASPRLDVTRRRGEREDLLQALADGIPPIVEVATEYLTYWIDESTAHVVVLAAITGDDDREYAIVNDPAFNAPVRVAMDELLIAWTERQNYFAIIQRKI